MSSVLLPHASVFSTLPAEDSQGNLVSEAYRNAASWPPSPDKDVQVLPTNAPCSDFRVHYPVAAIAAPQPSQASWQAAAFLGNVPEKAKLEEGTIRHPDKI